MACASHLRATQDRDIFCKKLIEINEPIATSLSAVTVEEALAAGESIGCASLPLPFWSHLLCMLAATPSLCALPSRWVVSARVCEPKAAGRSSRVMAMAMPVDRLREQRGRDALAGDARPDRLAASAG